MATNSSTTPAGETPENQINTWQVTNPTEWAKTTIKSKAMWLLLALKMAVWGSWVANAWEIPQDQTKITPPWKELVVNQNWEQKMLDELWSLTDDFILKYNSINENNKKIVLKYYNDNHEKWKITLKITYQLTDLLYNIYENDKFREKFSSLIVDWKFVGDENIVEDVKKLPKSLRWIYANLLKLDPNIKNLFWANFEEFLVVIDKNKMMFGEVIEQLKKERLAKDKQELAKDKQELTEKKQELAKHEELLKALERNSALYEKFLKDFNKIDWVVN